MTVDTLSLAKELRAAELSSTQAEAIATAIGHAVIEGSATRADLKETKSELTAQIEQLKSTMLLWFIGTNLTLAAIIIAALKL